MTSQVNWEIGINMYTLMCIKWMANKNLLYKKVNKIKFKIYKQLMQLNNKKANNPGLPWWRSG